MAKKGRRLLGFLMAIIVIAVIGIACLPLLINAGLGRGMIEGAISQHINGSASIGELSIGWFGPQAVRGLVIDDADGATVADVNASVDASLWALVRGAEPLRIALDGEVRTDLLEDNSFSITGLARTDETSAAVKGPGAARSGASATATPIPTVELSIGSLDVIVREVAIDRSITLSGMTGKASFHPGALLAAHLTGESKSDQGTGKLAIDLEADKLFDQFGKLKPKDASLDFEMTVGTMPVVRMSDGNVVESLTIIAKSADLTESLIVSVNGSAVLEGADASSLAANVSLDEPMSADGAITFDVRRLIADISGQGVPMSLVQLALGRVGDDSPPVDLVRDVGATADIDAAFTGGEAAGMFVSIIGSQLTAKARGVIDQASDVLALEQLEVSAIVDPALVSGFSDAVALGEPTRVKLDMSTFETHMPAPGEAFSLGTLRATGMLTMDQPVTMTLKGEKPRVLNVEKVSLQIDTPGLADGLMVAGGATVDGGRIDIDESIRGLVDAQGELRLSGAQPVGRIDIRDLPRSTVQKFVDLPAGAIDEVMGQTLNATVESRDAGEMIEWTAQATSGDASIQGVATMNAGVIDVRAGQLDVRATPQLVTSLQSESESPVVLGGPSNVSVSVEPFTIDLNNEAGPMADVPISGRLGIDSAIINAAPGLTSGVRVNDLRAQYRLEMKEVMSLDASGTLDAALLDGAQIGPLAFEVGFSDLAQGALSRAIASSESIHITGVERVLGQESGTIANWTGSPGRFTASLDAAGGTVEGGRVELDFPQAKGGLNASISDAFIDVRTDGLDVLLPAERVAEMLNASAPTEADRVSVLAEVPIHLTSERARLPRGLFSDDVAFNPKDVDVKVQATAGALRLARADRIRMLLNNIVLDLACTDLNQGAEMTIRADSASSAPGQDRTDGRIDIQAMVTNLVNAAGDLNTDNPRLTLDSTLEGVPSVVIDANVGLGGKLVAALGPMIHAAIDAKEFSKTTGTIEAQVSSAYGELNAKARALDYTLVISADEPLTASLEPSEALREDLLKGINPVLRDIRTVENGRIRMTFFKASIPLDGEVSKLNGDLLIEIGEVEFDKGSAMLVVLLLAKEPGGKTIPGNIEPIRATIRNGIIEYERFNMTVGTVPFSYSGRIDLNTRQIALKTPVPLGAIVNVFGEVRETEGTMIPVLTHGTLDNYKTEVDPNAKIEDFIGKDQLKGILDDLLKKNTGGGGSDKEPSSEKKMINDILGGLLGGEKKPPPEEDPKP